MIFNCKCYIVRKYFNEISEVIGSNTRRVVVFRLQRPPAGLGVSELRPTVWDGRKIPDDRTARHRCRERRAERPVANHVGTSTPIRDTRRRCPPKQASHATGCLNNQEIFQFLYGVLAQGYGRLQCRGLSAACPRSAAPRPLTGSCRHVVRVL